MNLFGSTVVYAGLLVMLAGIASVVKPMKFIGTRKRGAGIFGLGLLVVIAGFYLPAADMRSAAQTRLDEFAPVFQFHEFHSVAINAPKDRVYAAIQSVTPQEIRFFQALMWIRRFGKPSPPGVLNAPEQQPILHTFTKGGFLLLADDPDREIAFGRAGTPYGGRLLVAEEFETPHHAPFIKIAMNFRIHDLDASRCLLTTETRVDTAGFNVRHGFAAYWRVIYPGSALIRMMWLEAIKKRAEMDNVGADIRTAALP